MYPNCLIGKVQLAMLPASVPLGEIQETPSMVQGSALEDFRMNFFRASRKFLTWYFYSTSLPIYKAYARAQCLDLEIYLPPEFDGP